MNIRVTGAELDRENVESVALLEHGGYLSWIGAFHQLHCIVCGVAGRCVLGHNSRLIWDVEHGAEMDLPGLLSRRVDACGDSASEITRWYVQSCGHEPWLEGGFSSLEYNADDLHRSLY